MELEEGTRVRILDSALEGVIGTIVHYVDSESLGVQLDIEPQTGMYHDCAGHAQNGTGWYFPKGRLRAIEGEQESTPPELEITPPHMREASDWKPEHMPFYGQRVMVRDGMRYGGEKGTVIGMNAMEDTILHTLKNPRGIRRWNTTIKSDSGRIDTYTADNLILLDEPMLNIHHLKFENNAHESIKYIKDDTDEERRIDRLVIKHGYKVKERVIFGEEYRKKMLESL